MNDANIGAYKIARLMSGGLALVRIERARYNFARTRHVGYHARNIETGREVVLKSAGRILRDPTSDELRARRYLPATGQESGAGPVELARYSIPCNPVGTEDDGYP